MTKRPYRRDARNSAQAKSWKTLSLSSLGCCYFTPFLRHALIPLYWAKALDFNHQPLHWHTISHIELCGSEWVTSTLRVEGICPLRFSETFLSIKRIDCWHSLSVVNLQKILRVLHEWRSYRVWDFCHRQTMHSEIGQKGFRRKNHR